MKHLLTLLSVLLLLPAWHAGAHSDCVCTAEGNWSDPATWGGNVPHAGSNVMIPAGLMVHLDTTTANLGSVVIEGHLKVLDTGDIAITAEYIIAQHGGIFSAGSEDQPFLNKLTITLTGTITDAVPGMGGRLLGAHHGGKIQLIGAPPAITWTFLNATAPSGATTLTLDQAPGWKVGDEIIITSTDYDYAQTEKRTITEIADRTVTLGSPLNYLHYGEITYVEHDKANVPRTIDERAEVGLLTHNIKVQGAADSETAGFGGHTMVMDTSVAKLRGVEFYRMGQKGILGRYPMHWHGCDDGGQNSFMESCSTHHSFNRGTTIHKSNNLRITGNVTYDTLGHGYFFEDGKETGNTLTRNLVALVHRGPLDIQFLKDGFQQPAGGVPACYWITNPNNHFIDNAAAGQAPGGIGFWYDLHTLPRPGSITALADPTYNPKAQPFGVFRGNRAHSATEPTRFNSMEPAWGLFIEQRGALIENFTAFKNQRGQVWTIGGSTIQNSSLAGDVALFNGSVLKDSLVVGRTRNPILVEPANDTWEFRGFELERSLGGKLQLADTALQGYDDLPFPVNCVFANYRGILRLRKHAVVGGFTENCTFLNNDLYRTYFIANVDGFDAATAENSLFAREDPRDDFGNGAAGFFTYTKTLTDDRSRSLSTGAKGIEPGDNLQWWTPGRLTDFYAFLLNKRGSQALPYTVFFQPEGKSEIFPARIGPDFNGGSVHQSNAKAGTLTRVTFGGTVLRETISFRVAEGLKQKGTFLLFTLPMFSGETPTFYHEAEGQRYQMGGAPPQSSTKEEFNSATASTYLLSGAVIYIKLQVTDHVFTIGNYTLDPNRPPLVDAVPVQQVSEGELFEYPIVAFDAQGRSDLLAYSLTTAVPPGMTLDAATGVLQWQTSEYDGGSKVTVGIQVTDRSVPPRISSRSVAVHVMETNRSPTLAGIAPQRAVAGAAFSLTATSVDADRPLQYIRYRFGSPVPAGLTVDSVSGELRWTPTRSFIDQTVSVTLIATDSAFPAGEASVTFPITVEAAPGVPSEGTELEVPGADAEAIAAIDVPFHASLAGTYAGLLLPTPDDRQARGFLTATISRLGGFTGTLRLAGAVQTLRGTVNTDGRLDATVFDRTGARQTARLNLQKTASGGKKLAGTVTIAGGEGGILYACDLQRAEVRTAANPSPVAGRYTMLIPTDETIVGEVSHGAGYALVSVSVTGSVRATGAFGEGGRLSQGGLISVDREWPFYAAVRSPVLSAAGPIRFRNVAGLSDFDGDLLFCRAPGKASPGFSIRSASVGSQYKTSGAGGWPLPALTAGANNAALFLAESEATADLGPWIITWDTLNRLVHRGGDQVLGTVAPATGLVSGGITRQSPSFSATFTGVVFQKQGLVGGFFRDGQAGGAFSIQPHTQ